MPPHLKPTHTMPGAHASDHAEHAAKAHAEEHAEVHA